MTTVTKGLIVAIVVILGIGYAYFKYSQDKISSQGETISNQKVIISSQKETIEEQNKNIKEIREILRSTNEEFSKFRVEVEQLRRKFNKVSSLLGSRDIGKLAQAKPKSIEKIINLGTRETLRCFEILGGSPLTEEEKNATKPSEINKACPKIANPNYLPN